MAAIEYVRPKLYQKQSDAFFNTSRYSWVEASTKAGKTVGCMAWLLEQALFVGKEGREFWWVAPTFAVAKIAFRRFLRGLPRRMMKVNLGDVTITLTNGAVIRFKGADKPDSLYGEDVWAAVMDEASRQKQEAYYAVRSTLTATRGPIRLIGNVKGRKNWFYLGCRKAEGGEVGHEYHKIIATDAVEAGVFPQEELDDARRALPEAVFKELYLCEPTDDGGNPFGLQFIRKLLAPIRLTHTVANGADLAKSVDWTVIHGLDAEGYTTQHHRFQLPWEATIDRLKILCGSTETLVDSTGVGDPIVERLQKGSSNFQGFKFTQQSKQMLMEGLAVAIQRGEVHYPDGVIVSELESFEYEYTRTGVKYSAPEGFHDDCVVALALAVHMKNSRGPEPGLIVL